MQFTLRGSERLHVHHAHLDSHRTTNPEQQHAVRRVPDIGTSALVGRWQSGSAPRTFRPGLARAPAAIHSRWRWWLFSGRRGSTRAAGSALVSAPTPTAGRRNSAPRSDAGACWFTPKHRKPATSTSASSPSSVVTHRRPPSRLAHGRHPQNPPRLTPGRERGEQSFASRGALGARENEKRCKPLGDDQGR